MRRTSVSRLVTLFLMGGLLAGCAQVREPDSTPAQSSPPSPAPDAQSTPPSQKSVLFLGDSLSAGFGLDPEQAFPALIQRKIEARGWDFQVVNAGVSGDTTAGGLRRVDWLLRQPVDVLVLELGGNDGLRGISPEVTRQNLQGIIDKTRARYPEAAIVVAGMLVPPNMGPDYFNQFRTVFPEIAAGNGAVLIPFLLEGVAGRPELNLPDGIHPTAEGHRIVAEHVWGFLEPVLASRAGKPSSVQ